MLKYLPSKYLNHSSLPSKYLNHSSCICLWHYNLVNTLFQSYKMQKSNVITMWLQHGSVGWDLPPVISMVCHLPRFWWTAVFASDVITLLMCTPHWQNCEVQRKTLILDGVINIKSSWIIEPPPSSTSMGAFSEAQVCRLGLGFLTACLLFSQ